MRKEKKALIVGISDYGDKAPPLDSPVREIQEWRDLLMEEYGFNAANIRMLANDRARKDEIVHRLKWLYADAGPGDQLVFFFAGHGVRLKARDRNSGEILDDKDEALLAYPSSRTDDLEAMAIFDDDVFKLYAKSPGTSQASVTWIFDCCRGGGFNSRDLPRQMRVMAVPVPVDLRHRSFAERPGRNGSARSTRGAGMPVILNAAGELNDSVEMDLDGSRRSLFSYHAIKALREDPDRTYNELLGAIRDPIDDLYPQHANLRGNEARRNKSFLK